MDLQIIKVFCQVAPLSGQAPLNRILYIRVQIPITIHILNISEKKENIDDTTESKIRNECDRSENNTFKCEDRICYEDGSGPFETDRLENNEVHDYDNKNTTENVEDTEIDGANDKYHSNTMFSVGRYAATGNGNIHSHGNSPLRDQKERQSDSKDEGFEDDEGLTNSEKQDDEDEPKNTSANNANVNNQPCK